MTLEPPGPMEPVESAPPTQETPPSEGLLETAVGVVAEPVTTLQRVTREQNVGWAFVVTLSLGVLSIASTVAQFRSGTFPAGSPLDPFIEGPGLWVFAAIMGTIGTVLLLALWTGVLHLTSMILRGKGRYAGLFCGLAFAAVPNVFQVPIALAGAALGATATAVAGAIGFGISMWVLVLGVIAVRENYAFSTGRAIATVVLPIAALILFFIVLAVALAALFFAGVSGSGSA